MCVFCPFRLRSLFILSIVLGWLSLLLPVGFTRSAAAQPAAVLPAAPAWTELKVDLKQSRMKSKIWGILRAGEFADSKEQAFFDRYFWTYEFPRWTLVDNREELAGHVSGTDRTDFRRDLRIALKNCGTGDKPRKVHEHLNKLTLQYMTRLVGNVDPLNPRTRCNFHPAIRVNAALMIGDLNAKESPTSSEPPVPLPAALRELGKVVYGTDEQYPVAVKIAAMTGILRHTKLNAVPAGNIRTGIVTIMDRVLNTPNRTGKVAAGDAWLRAQAAEVLGHLREVGTNNKALVALAKTAGDRRLPLYTRVAAAKALGNLDYAMAVRLENGRQIAVALCQLAVDAVDGELAQENGQAPISRARLKERLTAASSALKGGFATVPGVPRTAGLHQLIDAMIKTVGSNQPDATVMEQIKVETDKLRRVLPGGSQPKTAPPQDVPPKPEADEPPPPPPDS